MLTTGFEAFIVSMGVCYFMHCKNGWYPDLLRSWLKPKPSKLKFNLFKTWGGDTGDKLVAENDTIDNWFKKLVGCPYCWSFWVSMIYINHWMLATFFAVPFFAYICQYISPKIYKPVTGVAILVFAHIFPIPLFTSLFIAMVVMTICEKLGFAIVEI